MPQHIMPTMVGFVNGKLRQDKDFQNNDPSENLVEGQQIVMTFLVVISAHVGVRVWCDETSVKKHPDWWHSRQDLTTAVVGPELLSGDQPFRCSVGFISVQYNTVNLYLNSP